MNGGTRPPEGLVWTSTNEVFLRRVVESGQDEGVVLGPCPKLCVSDFSGDNCPRRLRRPHYKHSEVQYRFLPSNLPLECQSNDGCIDYLT